jgi:DNA-binding NtrC family response regulator
LIAQVPDLLIYDVDLDCGPDPTLSHEVRTIVDSAIPTIVMTTNVWTARSLARQGVNFCLLKPFDLDELFTCVARYIGSAGGYAGVPLLEQAAGTLAAPSQPYAHTAPPQCGLVIGRAGATNARPAA